MGEERHIYQSFGVTPQLYFDCSFQKPISVASSVRKLFQTISPGDTEAFLALVFFLFNVGCFRDKIFLPDVIFFLGAVFLFAVGFLPETAFFLEAVFLLESIFFLLMWMLKIFLNKGNNSKKSKASVPCVAYYQGVRLEVFFLFVIQEESRYILAGCYRSFVLSPTIITLIL